MKEEKTFSLTRMNCGEFQDWAQREECITAKTSQWLEVEMTIKCNVKVSQSEVNGNNELVHDTAIQLE